MQVDEEHRWIPNTGEFLTFSLELTNLRDGVRQVLPAGVTAEFRPPADRLPSGGVVPAGDHGNIYENAGTGFELVALKRGDSGYQAYRVLQWILNEDGDYSADYESSDVYTQAGVLRDGASIPVSGAGMIALVPPEEDEAIHLWGIRPLSPGIQPGDDILIGVEIHTPKEVPRVVSAKSTQYMAVYDKKLVWRANLYMNEQNYNGQDWNDVHPWNAGLSGTGGQLKMNMGGTQGWQSVTYADETLVNWYGMNNWNRVYVDLPDKSKPELDDFGTQGTGGQVITLKDFTWYKGDTKITGAVSYDYNGQDSPFEFNHKMLQQGSILGQMYFDFGLRFLQPRTEWESGLSSFSDITSKVNTVAELLKTWGYIGAESEIENQTAKNEAWAARVGPLLRDWPVYAGTFAPLGVHGNYIRPNVYDGDYDTGNAKLPGDSLTIDDVAHYPYVPGLSNAINTFNGAKLAGYTAGLDCVAFVQRSASYENSEYEWITIDGNSRFLDDVTRGPVYWGGSRGITWYPIIDAYKPESEGGYNWDIVLSHEISRKTLIGQSINLDNIKPGDMMYYGYEGKGSLSHIAMVQDVKDMNGNGEIELNEILLIESRYNGPVGNITIDRNLSDINGSESVPASQKNWIIVRLK